MAQRPSPEATNGQVQNGRPDLHPKQYQVPAQNPQQVLIIPQQPETLPINPHVPQMPAISEASYIRMQEIQLGVQMIPMLVPQMMSSPMQFVDRVAGQMDEITSYVVGEEDVDMDVEFKF
jgi:hypothetical protein